MVQLQDTANEADSEISRMLCGDAYRTLGNWRTVIDQERCASDACNLDNERLG